MSIQEHEPRRDRLWLMVIGHYGVWLFLAGAAIALVSVILWHGSPKDVPPGGLILSAATMLLLLAWIFPGGYHDARLCTRCSTATPLDPQDAVSRRRELLHWQHARRRLRFPVVFGACAAQWFLGLIPGPWRVAADVVTLAVLCFEVISRYFHVKLYPWCPWCRWGGRGDGEEVTAPEPDPAMSR